MKQYKRFFTLIGHLDIDNKEKLSHLPLFLKERIVDINQILETESELHVNLLDKKHELIMRVPLSLSHYCGDPGGSLRLAVRGYIPFDEHTQIMRFEYKGEIIDELLVPKEVPQIKVTTTLPKYIGCKDIKLEWEISYAGDSSLLEYKVLYTNNGGTAWQRIGDRTKKQEMFIDTDTLVGGDDCRFSIHVTDGYNNEYTELEGFCIENKPNEVMIKYPLDGDTFSSERSILFNGQCYDPNSGEEITEGLLWTSSIDRVIGEGPLLQVSLTKGEHLIQLQVGGVLDSACLHIV